MGTYEDLLNEGRAALGHPTSQPYSDSPGNAPATPPSSSMFPSWIQDTGVDVLKGAVGVGESVVGVGNLLTGNALGEGLKSATGYDPKRTKEFLSTG